MSKHPCSKFEGCSAPICPFDSERKNRKHLNGEPVCFYLSEYSKESTRAILMGAIGVKFHKTIGDAYPDIYYSYGVLKNRLNRSAKTPSRLTNA